jgi:UDP-N-acetylglucosamine:LPS N-acetylglucosamine transferase
MTVETRKPVALVVISGGGFTFETKCLFQTIGADFEFIYLATRFGGEPGEPGLPAGARYAVPSFSTVTQKSRRGSLDAFIKTFTLTRKLIRSEAVDLVLAIGCSHAIPMLLAGRLMRRKTVYIESITRVDRLSNTGRLVYHLRLASHFFVQWPRLQQSYPASQLGTIL